LPLNRLLTETDGPFVLVACVPVRKLAVADTVGQLAKVRGVSPRDIDAQVLTNPSLLVSQ